MAILTEARPTGRVEVNVVTSACRPRLVIFSTWFTEGLGTYLRIWTYEARMAECGHIPCPYGQLYGSGQHGHLGMTASVTMFPYSYPSAVTRPVPVRIEFSIFIIRPGHAMLRAYPYRG